MGKSKSSSNTSYNQNQSQTQRQEHKDQYGHTQGSQQQIRFGDRSVQEQELLNQIHGLGQTQNEFLGGLIGGNVSPFALNDTDKAMLDQSYQSAFDRFVSEGKDYADFLAGTRGLNKSDTPVSQQAMERYGLGMSDLVSNKANAALQLGFQGAGLRLQGAGMAPIGLTNAFNALYNERLAAPTTTNSGWQSGGSSSSGFGQGWSNTNGTQNTTQTFTPSIMSQIGQGMGLAGQALSLGAGIGALGMGGMGGAAGLGGIMSSGGGGMGSGAAANSWFGPTPAGGSSYAPGMGKFFTNGH